MFFGSQIFVEVKILWRLKIWGGQNFGKVKFYEGKIFVKVKFLGRLTFWLSYQFWGG